MSAHGLNGCQCEHRDHDGGPGHPYGQANDVVLARTTYGTFDLCRDCIRSHHMVGACFQLVPAEMCAACAATLGHRVVQS